MSDVLSVVIAVFAGLTTVIMFFIGFTLSGIRGDIKELRSAIEKVRDHADAEISKGVDKAIARIHKVIEDEIEPMRDRVERLERVVAVLKSSSQGGSP